jgi:hypothetical protein
VDPARIAELSRMAMDELGEDGIEEGGERDE